MLSYKSGFSLIELVIVISLVTTSFVMVSSILHSFSSVKKSRSKTEVIKELLNQVKYLVIQGQKDISISCSNNQTYLHVADVVVDTKEGLKIECEKQYIVLPTEIKFTANTDLVKVKINQNGHISI